MRIVAIRDIVSPIRSNIANAYIDFSQMTASVVAIETDLKVEGKPVIGYGFNSNGRYAQHGLLNERFIPRLEAGQARVAARCRGPARSGQMLGGDDGQREAGRPRRALGRRWACSTWRCGMPLAKAKRVPLWKLLADRYNGGKYDDKAWVYAAGGYYYPGKDLDGLQDEMKHYLDLGYSCVKMKVGGVPLAEDLKRIEAVLKIVGVGRSAGGRRQRQVRPADRDRLRQGDRGLRPALVRGAARSARLPGARRPRHPVHPAARHRREPVLDAGRAQPRPPWRAAARSRHPAVRSRAVLRPGRVPAHPRHAEGERLVAAALRAARRPPVRAQHRRRPAVRRQRILSAGLRAVRRLRRRLRRWSTARWPCPTRPASASSARPTCGRS